MGPERPQNPARESYPVEIFTPQQARNIIEQAHAGPLLATVKLLDRYGNAFWRHPNGTLRRIFPKKGTNHSALWSITGRIRGQQVIDRKDDSGGVSDEEKAPQ
jgi:hypothetical protein